MTTVVEGERVEQLRKAVRGPLLQPADPDYDQARRLFNGMIVKSPALILRPAGAADVVRAVSYAAEQGLPVAVKGGGHNVAGYASCDDGVLIDFSRMRGIRVDLKRRTARVEPGVTYADFDPETVAFGLATTGGTVASTGLAGLTLGGGLGHLMGSYGLACDNVISVDMVLADGTLLTASADEHRDLYWAVRGGGGNFGVITSFEYRLHPVGQLLGGLLIYPFDQAQQVLTLFKDVTHDGPDELGLTYAVVNVPGMGWISLIAVCYNGPLDRGEAAIRQLRRSVRLVDDGVHPMPYTEVQRLFAEIPFGLQNYWKGYFIEDFTTDAISAVTEQTMRITSEHSAVLIEAPHGAVHRVAEDATAFKHRTERYNVSALAIWEGTEDSARHIKWARDFAGAIERYSHGSYINYLPDDAGVDQVKESFDQKQYQRLVDLKTRYDPGNMFRFNQNVPPRAGRR